MSPKIGKVRNPQSLLAKQMRAVTCAVTLALLVLCSAISRAQTTTSSQINGAVTDSSGAVIPIEQNIRDAYAHVGAPKRLLIQYAGEPEGAFDVTRLDDPLPDAARVLPGY